MIPRRASYRPENRAAEMRESLRRIHAARVESVCGNLLRPRPATDLLLLPAGSGYHCTLVRPIEEPIQMAAMATRASGPAWPQLWRASAALSAWTWSALRVAWNLLASGSSWLEDRDT